MRRLILLALFPLTLSADGLRNVSPPAGLTGLPAGRAQLIDIDGDGWLDLCLGGRLPNKPGVYRIYRNVPGRIWGRRFREITARTGLGDPRRQHSFILWGDLDGDGNLDAVSVANQTAEQHAKDPQTHRVYIGAGGGRFTPRPTDGLARKGHRTTQGATLADLDLDGRLDAVFGNSYDHYGKSLVAQPMRVYRGDGDGTFSDVTSAWGLLNKQPPGGPQAARPLYGLSAADLDGNGYPELLGAAYGRQWNTVWQRDAKTTRYRNIAARLKVDGDTVRHGKYPEWVQAFFIKRSGKPRETEKPFRSNGNTFALAPCDFDGDGDIDLFCASITHAWAGEASDLSALLVNQLSESGKLVYAWQLVKLDQPDPQTGWRWRPGLGLDRDHTPQTVKRWNQGDLQAHWADLNNDGRVDLLVCESDYPHNRLRIWLQQPGHRFAAAEKQLGILWNNCPGLALGDIDRDGDIDLVATGSRNRWKEARPKPALSLWENRTRGGFLALKLVGDSRTANRDAIGARVTLVTSAGTQTRILQGPHGHWAAQTQPGELHFGLGDSTPRKLTVHWPDGKRTRTELGPLPRNSWVVIRQGQAQPVLRRQFDASAWR